MKPRQVTDNEIKGLLDYLATTEYWGKHTRESLESIFEEVVMIVFENFEVEEIGYKGKALHVYAPEPDSDSQLYYWPHGKITRAGTVYRP